MTAVLVLVILLTAGWIAFDASQRDWRGETFARNPITWVVGSLGLWFIVFPVYLLGAGASRLVRVPRPWATLRR